MIPGTTTKLSEEAISLETTIKPKADLVRVTSTATTTAVATIVPSFGGGFSGILIVVNLSGANITTTTAGNIQTAITIGQNISTVLTYSKTTGKWYPGALA
jgi:hypothetical protein